MAFAVVYGFAGIPFGWVTADQAYGDNGPLRSYLESCGIAYVMAVACAHVLVTAAGRHRARRGLRPAALEPSEHFHLAERRSTLVRWNCGRERT